MHIMKSKKKHKKNITNSTYVGGSVKKIKKKRKNYPVENLNHALEAIKRGAPIKRAAAVYGIPVATLFRKHKNPDAINKKPGPKTYLPESVEKDIVNWIVVRAQVGDPVTKAQLFDAVQKYVTDTKLKTPFINNRPNKHWYQSFRKRHPNISIRKPQKLSHTRASVTQEDLKQWFEEVAEFLKEKDVFGIGADRYFNCDETSLPLSPESDVVLANKGSLNVYQVGDDGKQCVTVLSVYSASGMRAPPMVMFSYKHTIPKGILEKLPEGWGVGNSDSGWQTSETFYEYMTNVFNPWIEKQSIPKPVVMFLDNHSSHLTPPLITWCRENKIELIGLLPNSTHLIQPLDIAFFHPFKLEWKRTLLKWKNERCTTTLKKEDISIVINETLNNMKNEKQIVINGFRAAGLFPFDPKAVDFNVLNKKKKGKKTLDQQVETSENIEQHLKMFETRLNPDLVVQFKEAEQNGVWMGDEKFTGLFEYWLSCHKGTLN